MKSVLNDSLDYSRTVPEGKVLVFEIMGRTEVRRPGDEVTQEQMDGGMLLDYSASCRVVTVPKGYVFFLNTENGLLSVPGGHLVDLKDMEKGRLQFGGSPYGRRG